MSTPEGAAPTRPPVPPRVNGSHDIGGAAELGPVPVHEDGLVFPEPWEGVVMGMSLGGAVSGVYAIDQHRAAVGRIHPALYMATTYYEQWLYALETCLVGAGVVTREEIENRVTSVAENPDLPLPENDNPELTERMKMVIAHGIPEWDLDTEPVFSPGDRVRAKVVRVDSAGHTRMPGYAQGRTGVVEEVFPPEPRSNPVDAGGERPIEHVYRVCFKASDIWPDADPEDSVRVELWESYLETAGGNSPSESREEEVR
jgi:nitrile hydratase beta subunit